MRMHGSKQVMPSDGVAGVAWPAPRMLIAYLVATLRSLEAHTTFDAFDLRSLAAELNRCSAP
jgi:hypothetical protein